MTDEELKEKTQKYIDLIGYKRISKRLNITPQAVLNWKRRGSIPPAQLRYLKIIFRETFNHIFKDKE